MRILELTIVRKEYVAILQALFFHPLKNSIWENYLSFIYGIYFKKLEMFLVFIVVPWQEVWAAWEVVVCNKGRQLIRQPVIPTCLARTHWPLLGHTVAEHHTAAVAKVLCPAGSTRMLRTEPTLRQHMGARQANTMVSFIMVCFSNLSNAYNNILTLK